MTLVSAPAVAGAFAPETAEVYLTLLELKHPTWGVDHRFVNDLVDVVSGGDTFTSFAFDARLPSETDKEPEARLKVANVTQEIGELALALRSRPTVKLQVVLASSPDTVEFEFDGFELHDIKGNELFVEGVLTQRQYSREIAGPRMTPGGFAFLRK